MHARAFIKGAALGAAAAYLFDPIAGNGRRARLRDQTGALLRRGRERADALSRHGSNVVEGVRHEFLGTAEDRPMDDTTVADRIRSEVLGRRELEASDAVLNVEDGVAVLRGEVPRADLIEAIVDRTRAVAGVRSVESLLHVPDQPAPKKQAARSAGKRTGS